MKASAANEGPRTVGWTKRGTQKRQGILHAIAWTTALLIGVLGARTAHADTCATFLNCKDPHQPICGLDSQCHPCTSNSDCVPIGGATSVCLGASGDAGAANNGECSQPCSVD